MLARENRLRQASDIARVYKRGKYGGASGVLSVKAVESGRSQLRAVVVVGKKVSKRAVVRNRIRRRLIGDLEQRLATLRGGYDIVVSVHSDISAMPADSLAQAFTLGLERAGVLGDKR
jgi:ribonuclease P protein component